jgi:hypothetical protein
VHSAPVCATAQDVHTCVCCSKGAPVCMVIAPVHLHACICVAACVLLACMVLLRPIETRYRGPGDPGDGRAVVDAHPAAQVRAGYLPGRRSHSDVVRARVIYDAACRMRHPSESLQLESLQSVSCSAAAAGFWQAAHAARQSPYCLYLLAACGELQHSRWRVLLQCTADGILLESTLTGPSLIAQVVCHHHPALRILLRCPAILLPRYRRRETM